MKDSKYFNIYCVDPLYLTIGEVDVSNEEKNESKYLAFGSKDKNKEVLEKYTVLLDEIKSMIEKIDNKSGEYRKDYMKI